MTAEEPIRPASEETRYCLTDRNSAWEPCYQQRLKLEQAEVYAATIRERDEEIAMIKSQYKATMPLEETIEREKRGRERADAYADTLKAQNAAQAGMVERLVADLEGLERRYVALRARCERYEDLIVLAAGDSEDQRHFHICEEARAIRARKAQPRG